MKARTSSFEKNPAKNGNPASASAPIVNVTNVNGIALRKPPILSSDCVPPIAAITDPAPMKRSALKNACAMRRNIPALYANAETPRIM